MNRRDFLRALITIPLAARIPIPNDPLDLYFDTSKLRGIKVVTDLNWDKNAIYFINMTEFYFNNPRACAVITNITDGEISSE